MHERVVVVGCQPTVVRRLATVVGHEPTVVHSSTIEQTLLLAN